MPEIINIFKNILVVESRNLYSYSVLATIKDNRNRYCGIYISNHDAPNSKFLVGGGVN